MWASKIMFVGELQNWLPNLGGSNSCIFQIKGGCLAPHYNSDMSQTQKNQFKFIDLFAGIGGLRIPFGSKFQGSAGGKCVFTSEKDKFAAATYSENFEKIEPVDITSIKPADIEDFDLLLAGFPCQPFSHAGKKLGFEDLRGTLFFNIASIIKEKRPKVVLLENVRGLLSHDAGRTFARILEVLEAELGYTVFYKVLNAKDFGLPQNRSRVFVVAFRDEVVDFQFPEPTGLLTNVGQILVPRANRNGKYTLSDQLWQSHQRRKASHMAKGNGFGYSLFDSKSPYTSTISARYYKDGSEILIKQIGKNPRKLTPREAANLQGFPEDFVIPVSDTQAYKQFGNAVAVPVVLALSKKIIPYLS
jgi:DNA (cytosine-5)-methyltransferase 1